MGTKSPRTSTWEVPSLHGYEIPENRYLKGSILAWVWNPQEQLPERYHLCMGMKSPRTGTWEVPSLHGYEIPKDRYLKVPSCMGMKSPRTGTWKVMRIECMPHPWWMHVRCMLSAYYEHLYKYMLIAFLMHVACYVHIRCMRHAR